MKTISVIVPTAGRPERLERLLESLAAQTLPQSQWELFVAIDGTDARSVELLTRWQGRFDRLGWSESGKRQGPATARNRAWRNTEGAIVAMTDDDCEPQPGWLAAFVEAFRHRPAAAGLVGCTLTDLASVTPLSHFVENRSGEGHQTCNSAYRRWALEEVGGFDERFPGAYLEDTDFYCRVTQLAPVEFIPEAVVIHPPRPTGVLDFARSARKYRSDFLFYQKAPELYRSRHEGKGPVPALLWDVGVKHTLKELLRHAPWLVRAPWLYLRYSTAMLLFTALLFAEVARSARYLPAPPETGRGTA